MLRYCSFLAAIAALAACGDDDRMVSPDAGFDAGPPDASFDAGFDAGPSYLFGPCTDDSQCPGEGAFCRKPEEGWPMGYCTVPCPGGDRGPCDDGFRYNHCLEDPDSGEYYCELRCLNGADCSRDSYTCVGSFDSMGAGMCVGVCSSDEECGEGAVCNPWSGKCVAPGGVPTSGSETGGECDGDDACKSGDCILAYPSSFSGWTDGYCIGPCILPMGYNTSTFYSGETLPPGTCTGNAVCFPNGSYTRDDLGICLAACTTDADCRDDDAYYCLKEIDLPGGDTSTYTNGVCLPMDCSTDPCPTGFTCQSITTTSGTIRRCERM